MMTKDVYAEVRKQWVQDWHVLSHIPFLLSSTVAWRIVANLSEFSGEVSHSRGALRLPYNRPL